MTVSGRKVLTSQVSRGHSRVVFECSCQQRTSQLGMFLQVSSTVMYVCYVLLY
jgi:hypothetical protein